jgi:quinol monooxygenase YgiN
MLIQLVHFIFKTEDTDNAEVLLRELRDASRNEEGIIAFDVARSRDKPNEFALWEQYRDKAALDAHMATDHYNRLVLGGLRPLAKHRDGEMMFPL